MFYKFDKVDTFYISNVVLPDYNLYKCVTSYFLFFIRKNIKTLFLLGQNNLLVNSFKTLCCFRMKHSLQKLVNQLFFYPVFFWLSISGIILTVYMF